MHAMKIGASAAATDNDTQVSATAVLTVNPCVLSEVRNSSLCFAQAAATFSSAFDLLDGIWKSAGLKLITQTETTKREELCIDGIVRASTTRIGGTKVRRTYAHSK